MLPNWSDFLCFDVFDVFESFEFFYLEISFERGFFYFDYALSFTGFCSFDSLPFGALLLLLLF